MVIVDYALNIGNVEALDAFDEVTYIAFGNGTTTPTESQTALANELLRVPVTKVKDEVYNNYIFTGRIPITQLNTVTISELGLFNDSTAGDMIGRLLLITGLTKTSDDELIFRIKVEVNTINT